MHSHGHVPTTGYSGAPPGAAAYPADYQLALQFRMAKQEQEQPFYWNTMAAAAHAQAHHKIPSKHRSGGGAKRSSHSKWERTSQQTINAHTLCISSV
jgi:hypothetical protein